MDHHHWPQPGVYDPDLDVLDSPSELDQHGIFFIGHGHEIFFVKQHRMPGGIGIGDSCNLDLGSHDRTGAAGEKASPFPGHLGSVAGSGNDRWLLCSHGDEHFPAIDDEVGGNAQWNLHYSYHILYHLICRIQGQAPFYLLYLLFSERCLLCRSGKPLRGSQPVKSRYS